MLRLGKKNYFAPFEMCALVVIESFHQFSKFSTDSDLLLDLVDITTGSLPGKSHVQ